MIFFIIHTMDRDMIILAAVGVISLAGIISVFVLFFWSDHQRHKNKRKALSDRLNSLEGTLGELAGRQNLTTSERATLSTEQKAALKEYDDLQYENSELLDSTVDFFGPDPSKLKAKKLGKMLLLGIPLLIVLGLGHYVDGILGWNFHGRGGPHSTSILLLLFVTVLLIVIKLRKNRDR